MGELIAPIVEILKTQPAAVTLAIVGVCIVVTLILSAKRVDMDALTSISKAQTDNLTALLAQNRQLAEDLHKMRDHQAELHTQIDGMRTELAEARDEVVETRRHVERLEEIVRQYQKRCDTCPHNPGIKFPILEDRP